jgi:hypothetical protein
MITSSTLSERGQALAQRISDLAGQVDFHKFLEGEGGKNRRLWELRTIEAPGMSRAINLCGESSVHEPPSALDHTL